MNADLIAALRKAEDDAWHAIKSPDSDTAAAVHQAIAAALRIAETAAAGPRCEAPTCENAIEYSGVGRHRRFCSDRCRKAAHRASRQR
ncbi:hypothetical protein [Streptomyces sp. NPDC058451]|uniref:hypothetical protein n=1 Tax=Streptomyces sp. NPDC058451 TaxID=3346506 RepID=UPI00366483B9